jgi:hypothetical protein
MMIDFIVCIVFLFVSVFTMRIKTNNMLFYIKPLYYVLSNIMFAKKNTWIFYKKY